jgi:hypothetical protein
LATDVTPPEFSESCHTGFSDFIRPLQASLNHSGVLADGVRKRYLETDRSSS